jgi:hypothetical protein
VDGRSRLSACRRLGEQLAWSVDDFGGDVVTMMSGRRDLLGAAAEAELDYGYVDPPPDTYRRGGSAPIPHN